MDLLSISNNSRKSKRPIFYSILGMLSVVRGYNILTIVIAQYLASIFIFKADQPLKSVLLDGHLFIIIISTSLVIASGYIINNFYDTEIDKINKPIKSYINNFVSQKTKLITCFLFSTISFLLVFLVSWRASLFLFVFFF